MRARADVGIVLNESLDTSVARITGSGHSAVYLSRICPASPVKLRLCGPDENGSVISNYTTLGEDQPFEWNIVPLSLYLYGVASPQDRPLFSSPKIKAVLEDQYRESVLRDYCASQPCQTSRNAEWREMVSAASERTLYILIVSTTVEQDRELIAKFNSLPNLNHFNAATRNCADFARSIVNTYFPHAVHREHLNDFGVTSPKAIARSFAHFARRSPNADYRVVHIPQLPGTIKRSKECRDGTEQLYRSKKLLVPMALFAWHALPLAAGSYLLTGRFNPQREFEQHATSQESAIRYQLEAAPTASTSDARELRAAYRQDRADVLGNAQTWAAFHEQFDSIVDESVREGLLPSRDSLDHVFKSLSERGRPYRDNRGALWLEVQENGVTSQVGLSPSDMFAPGSDRVLAYQMILAHVDSVLKSPPRRRESISEFREMWSLLERAHDANRISLAVKR